MDPATRELDPDSAAGHLDRLYRAAWSMCGDRQDAEDLVQETYARVLARPRFLRKDDDLVYLLRALKNTFLVQSRKKRRQVRGEAVSPEADPADSQEYTRPHAQAEVREVYAAIAALPEKYRLAISAVDVTGLSYEEAAAALRLRPGTVRSRVFRARDRIASELGGQPTVESGTSAPGRSLSS